MGLYNLVSFAGIAVLLGVAWLMSSNRHKMNWRVIGWGVALQLAFAVFVFRSQTGRDFFVSLNHVVFRVLDSASAGSRFVFGALASNDCPLGFIIAFRVFPAIVFFSALMSILYYYRIMPVIIRGFAWVFTRTMKVSGAESLCAASNIFVGIESATTIRPHLTEMTRSELCTVLTAGMATVASSVMLGYSEMLKTQFGYIAGHLVSASIMSAPAALVFSKMLVPEDGNPKTLGSSVKPHYEKESSLFEAIINGANAGVKLVVGVAALLLAVIGLVALVNLMLGFAGARVNQWTGWEATWSLQGMLGYLFYPFVAVLGVPPEDIGIVSTLVGERVIMTEFVSYQHLAEVIEQIQPRSAVIAAYALCGFAHVASLAIFVGGVSALAPSRARDISQVAVRALIAATLACLMTACAAGIFFAGDSILFGQGA
jgi:CNT family concentrative nucleoside transporter